MSGTGRLADAGPTTSAAAPSWVGRLSAWLAGHQWAVLLALAPAVPLLFLGYGTDIDTWNVRAAADSLRHGHYVISRPPGAPVHEAATAVLDRAGGPFLTNLASLVAAAAVLLCVASILRRAGARHAELAAVAIAANPYFLVASSSLVDHLWALAFLLGGIEAKQRDHPVLAGVLWALAIGCRMPTALLVVAYVAAEVVVTRTVVRSSVIAALVAFAGGVLLFVPAWLSVGRSADFLQNTFGTPSFTGLLGRWVLKQLLFLGIPAAVVVAIGWRRLVGAASRWHANVVVAFALIGGLLEEILFFRLPWKFGHLLPILVCFVLLAALAPVGRPGWFVALAATQLVWGLVAVRTVVPDNRDNATRARWDVAVVAGPLASDVRCRWDDRNTPEPPTPDLEYAHAVALFTCANDWAYAGGSVDVPSSP